MATSIFQLRPTIDMKELFVSLSADLVHAKITTSTCAQTSLLESLKSRRLRPPTGSSHTLHQHVRLQTFFRQIR